MSSFNMWLPNELKKGHKFFYIGEQYEVISATYNERPSATFPLSHWYTLVRKI